MELDATTFLLQWAVGGMVGCWFTTRRREVGVGYGWLLRIVFGTFALGSVVIGWMSAGAGSAVVMRNALATVVTFFIGFALVSSIGRRTYGTGDVQWGFDPRLDALVALPGVAALIAAGTAAGGNDGVAIVRLLVGALFLGFVTDAMLLGHWYLVQPGLPRRHVNEIVSAFVKLWPLEVLAMLVPTGMVSVLVGTVDDGWGGLLGWFWLACAITTGLLGIVTLRALREPSYSAVMAATGLMYLAILTAFGTDLVARATLAT